MPQAAAVAKRPLGDTGVWVSQLGLGGNRLLTRPDGRDESAYVVERFADGVSGIRCH